MSERLTELLGAIDETSALAFVDEQIGPMLAYDRVHGSDLADQLERALDEIATRPLDPPETALPAVRPLPAGVVHALKLLHADLQQPSDRLALHLALKLHRVHSGS